MEYTSYAGWNRCIRLSDGEVEAVVTTDVGPRVIRFGFVGEPNLFFENPEDLGRVGGSEWRIYGGHRFWHAPEAFPRTYSPDNSQVEAHWNGDTLKLSQPVERDTGIRKQLEVTLHSGRASITLLHRAINENPWPIELAPWCPTAMAAGGRAIVPHEEYRSHPEYLLPARPLVLWHYTDMSDPRWLWGRRYIQLRQRPEAAAPLKIGVLNSRGWAAYALGRNLFIKRYPCKDGGCYPDFGCNTELFTDSRMLEIESLGPLTRLPADGGSVELSERWHLFHASVGDDEAEIAEMLTPLLRRSETGAE